MKNIKYGILFLALVGIGLVSCQKAEVFKTNQSNENLQLSDKQAGPIIGFFFTWDEWGRKNRDCRKAGLCNFRLEEIEIGWFCVPIQQEDNGDYYVEIYFDDSIEFEDEEHTFFIDENLYAKTPKGDWIMLPKGEYPTEPEIGEIGGVKLALVVVE
jgi:hypothetical protein